MSIKLSEEDRKKIVELVQRAENTPVIALSSQDMMEGKDFASLAWKDVREFMKELGKKYGYESKKMAINGDTGEVTPLEIRKGGS